jgi:ElaA protein
MKFDCVSFDQLTIYQLYELLALRQAVFVVEQNCPYQDCDAKDIKAWHLIGYNENKQLVAYARLLPKGVSYPEYASFGRVVTAPGVRGTGAGKLLLQKCLQAMQQLFPNESILIGAQLYLLQFYQSFGFVAIQKEYLEDGIPHIHMVLNK